MAELEGEIVGCGALHVLWADLGEVRTVAAHPKVRGMGVGHAVVAQLLDVARELELQRVFVLTFETVFFSRHGFREIEGTPVTAEVYEEMCRSYDTGVAEFLDLSYVKPNTLGQHPDDRHAVRPATAGGPVLAPGAAPHRQRMSTPLQQTMSARYETC
ncbi:Amino-acid acetyltransferase [Mycolicibacterium aubagnense]